MQTEYLTKQELASLLRVTTRTITNYQQRPEFPAPVRVGKRNLWSRAALIEYIAKYQGLA